MTFREPDYTEVMLLPAVLAKHLELAFKDSFKRQKWIHLAPKKETVISQCLLIARAEIL